MLFDLASGHLERHAEAYATAATTLRQIGERVEDYRRELIMAEGVEWQAEAGDAFREVINRLHQPGEFLQRETSVLAAEADLIAKDLRATAETSRAIGGMMRSLSGVDLSLVNIGMGVERLKELRDEAAEALQSPHSMTEFVDRHGGVPEPLRRAAQWLW